MRNGRETYLTLAAAVAAGCGVTYANAQEPVSETANRAAQQHALDDQLPVEEGVGREVRSERELYELEETVQEAQETVTRRKEIVQMAQRAIDRLTQEDETAAELLNEAHGFAVFDTTKAGLIVTGAGGTGVARELGNGEETFMHLGAAGLGVGAGFENYKLVMLFEDEQTYDEFVAGQWDGSVAAQAAAGAEGAATEEQFVDGIRSYRLTDAGLMAQVDVNGIRFWPSERLNDALRDA